MGKLQLEGPLQFLPILKKKKKKKKNSFPIPKADPDALKWLRYRQ